MCGLPSDPSDKNSSNETSQNTVESDNNPSATENK